MPTDRTEADKRYRNGYEHGFSSAIKLMEGGDKPESLEEFVKKELVPWRDDPEIGNMKPPPVKRK